MAPGAVAWGPFLMSVALLLSNVRAPQQSQQTPPSSSGRGSGSAVRVAVEPSTYKVPANATAPSEWATDGIDLAGQKGECEGAQLWLRPREANLTAVSITFTDLQGEGVGSVPASAFSYAQVAYVLCAAASNTSAGRCPDDDVATWNADPLLPIGHGESVPLIPAGFSQPLMVTLCVPNTTAAGVYRGALTATGHIQGGGAWSARVAVQAEVWPIALPPVGAPVSSATLHAEQRTGCHHAVA